LLRTDKYGLANSIGVPVEDALVVATLIFGGILDACPALKVCIAHGAASLFGMAASIGAGRCALRLAAIFISPEHYQRRLYYDCITNSEMPCAF